MLKQFKIVQEVWQEIAEPLLLIDFEGNIVLWSNGCQGELGFPSEEAIKRGKWRFIFSRDEDLARVMEEMSPILDKSFKVNLRDSKRKEIIARIHIKAHKLFGEENKYFMVHIENVSHKNAISGELIKARLEAKQKSLAVTRATDLLKQKEKLLLRNMAETKKLYEKVKKSESELTDKTTELETKVKELNRFNKLMIGRELQMVELKEQIKKLKNK